MPAFDHVRGVVQRNETLDLLGDGIGSTSRAYLPRRDNQPT